MQNMGSLTYSGILREYGLLQRMPPFIDPKRREHYGHQRPRCTRPRPQTKTVSIGALQALWDRVNEG